MSTIGSGGDYADLDAWMAAEIIIGSDLTSRSVILTAEILDAGTGGFDDFANITGFTTDASNYLEIKGETGEEWNSTTNGAIHQKSLYDGATLEHTINDGLLIINQDFTRVYNLRIRNPSTQASCHAIENLADNCQFYNLDISSRENGLYLSGDNNIVYNVISEATLDAIKPATYNLTNEVEHCAFVSSGTGIDFLQSNGEAYFRNCLFYSITGADTDRTTYTTNCSNNATTKSSMDLGSGNDNVLDVVSGDFTDAAGGDFSLASGSALEAAGVPATWTGATLDVLGNTRDASTPDIGPFELVGSGPPTLVVAEGAHAHSADALALTQVHSLSVSDSTHSHGSGELTLSQIHTLLINGATHAQVADLLTLSATSGVDLAIAGSLHGFLSDELVISQAHSLEIAQGTHTHSAEFLALAQLHVLAITGSFHGHSGQNLGLTQLHDLVVAGGLHGHSSEELTLELAGTLQGLGGLHAHTASNLGLIQAHILGVDGSLHTLESSQIALVQAFTLAIADASHGLVSESLGLSTETVLVIEGGLHNHFAENLALTQDHILSIQNAVSSLMSEQVTFQGLNFNLIISDSLHTHLASSCNVRDSVLSIAGGGSLFVVQTEEGLSVVANSRGFYKT